MIIRISGVSSITRTFLAPLLKPFEAWLGASLGAELDSTVAGIMAAGLGAMAVGRPELRHSAPGVTCLLASREHDFLKGRSSEPLSAIGVPFGWRTITYPGIA